MVDFIIEIVSEKLYFFIHTNIYYIYLNQKLQKTDAFMGQIDRYSQEQINQLKIYRQLLRDMINQEPIVFPEEPDFIRKVEEKQVRPKF